MWARRIYLQKPDGRQRPIGIAALEDKIVQQALVTILNEIYEVDFRGFSYGFRPGGSWSKTLRSNFLSAIGLSADRMRDKAHQAHNSGTRILEPRVTVIRRVSEEAREIYLLSECPQTKICATRYPPRSRNVKLENIAVWQQNSHRGPLDAARYSSITALRNSLGGSKPWLRMKSWKGWARFLTACGPQPALVRFHRLLPRPLPSTTSSSASSIPQTCLASVTPGPPLVESGGNFQMECRRWDRTNFRWHLIRALPMRDAAGVITKWIGTFTDIDENKRLNQQLEQRVHERTVLLDLSLAEKTLVLKEVHHRVKNNLQVICSLLAVRIECSDGDALSIPLIDANGRVLVMSLIHEQIYRSDNASQLDFGAYIELLAARLFSAYCVVPGRIPLELHIDTIQLSVDQATPCGLILNELLSNSLKHAFPNGAPVTIRLSLRAVGEGRVELEVSDHGIGLPPNFRVEGSQSMGLQVICFRGGMGRTGGGIGGGVRGSGPRVTKALRAALLLSVMVTSLLISFDDIVTVVCLPY